VRLAIKRIDPELPAPAYAHVGDAGLDLRSTVNITLAPGARALIPTGVAVAVPEGCAGFVLPRSGLAIKHGLGVVNAPGLIDSAYRGEIKAILVNHDPESPIVISRGDKIVQLVIQRVENCQIDVVAELDETVRGEGGFGSTGV
jgi:dUTP pyrophosphatase